MKRIAFFVIFFVCALPVFGTVPKLISFQGVLNDAGGQAVNGTHVLKLNLYDALTGGTLLYSDIESVTLTNGVFNVLLGNQIPFPDSLKFDRPYYLSISIDNGSELSPRSLLAPSPNALFAVHSGLSDSALGATPSGAAGGDLSGSYPAPVVKSLHSFPISAATPTTGQTLTWNGSSWAPASASAVAFSVIGLSFQTLPHDVFTTLDFTYNNISGAFDDGSYFSLDNDWFTAPSSGYYYFDAFVTLDTRSTPPTEFYIAFFVNGTEETNRRYYTITSGTYTQLDYTLPL
ncbi:MAG TPA: hypothetical protein VGM92_12900, partial [Candidatus Kapabacteria bacterium]